MPETENFAYILNCPVCYVQCAPESEYNRARRLHTDLKARLQSDYKQAYARICIFVKNTCDVDAWVCSGVDIDFNDN